jgi:CBS domain containing-hemolysin-like protein
LSLPAELAIVALLILFNGLFAMAELAIVSARRLRLRQMAEDGHKGAELALGMAEDPASFLSIVQIGMTLNSVLVGAFSGATLADPFAVYLNNLPWIAPNGGAVALGLTVAQLLTDTRQTPAVRRRIWNPLCLAALNTPPDKACAGTFAAVAILI